MDRDAMKTQMKIQNDDVNLAISEWKERDAKLKRAHAAEQKRLRKEITVLEEKYERISREFKESRQTFEIRIQEMTNSIEIIRTREENLLRENETLRQEIERMREEKKDGGLSQDEENNELRKMNASLSEQVKSTTMEVHKLASERTKLEQELRKIQDERSELEEKYSNHVSELDQKYSNHISELERGYSGHIARLEEEHSVASQNHIEKHYRNTIEARRELVHADMKLRNAKIRHSESLKSGRRESISNVENMRRIAVEHAERHNSVRDELSELEKKHESLIRSRAIVGEEEDDDEKMREMNRLEREIETLKTLHEVRLKRHLGDLSVSHQKAQIETENRHAKKLETYKSEASRLENELEQVRWDLNMSSARESNVSTEMDRMREDHQIRHDKEIEVVREFEMLLSKAEERERSGAEELILDHENAIEELKEAHQHHVSTEIDRMSKHHSAEVSDLKMQLSATNDDDDNSTEGHWKSRALELEKALREAKLLGEKAFSEIRQIQSTQQEQVRDEDNYEALESEIEDLKRQRASQAQPTPPRGRFGARGPSCRGTLPRLGTKTSARRERPQTPDLRGRQT